MKPSDSLNLARSWRPQTFNEIIGQQLSVRLLKNSLYKQRYFPVYLFAGQRGSGKTTTARIFAAALNCEQLPNFIKAPQLYPVPCVQCVSCKAARNGSHPDITEIDAASNTGVDNVRQIIDAALFLPQLGRKKIYLIDEAHMLSKAAFNAFLKILEEPPRDVIFMMATTDPQKILETVRSRCFQLFFEPIEKTVLVDHLASVCAQENIVYEREALALIVEGSEGSVRDALNMLEKIRLAHETITISVVQAVLQVYDLQACYLLLQAVAQNDVALVIQEVKKIPTSPYAVMSAWKLVGELLHDVIRHAHGVNVTEEYKRCFIEQLSECLSAAEVVYILKTLYAVEQQFLKTAAQHAFFELIMVQLCNRPIAQEALALTFPEKKNNSESYSSARVTEAKQPVVVSQKAVEKIPEIEKSSSSEATLWENFKVQVGLLGEPLLTSVMQQSRYDEQKSSNGTWHITIPKEMEFFNDVVQKLEPSWKKVLNELLGKQVAISLNYTLQSSTAGQEGMRVQNGAGALRASVSAQQHNTVRARTNITVEKKSSPTTPDLSNLPKTQIMLSVFPGTVTQIKEYDHE